MDLRIYALQEKESAKSFKHNPKLKLIAFFTLSFSLNFIGTCGYSYRMNECQS
jgi:hypothetical protein